MANEDYNARMDRMERQLEILRDRVDEHAVEAAQTWGRHDTLQAGQERFNEDVDKRVRALERVSARATAFWALMLFLCNGVGLLLLRHFIKGG